MGTTTSDLGAKEWIGPVTGTDLLVRRKAFSPVRRPALVLVLLAAVLGLFGAYQYLWGFWLYRGFPPPRLPRELPVALATPEPPAAQRPSASPHPVAGRALRVVPATPAARHAAALAAAARLVAPMALTPAEAPAPAEHLVPVLPGTLETIEVQSPLPGVRLPAIVYLPPGYFDHPDERFPALYLLHGSPGRPQQFIDVADVQVAEALLVARHQMAPMVIVIPEGGTSFLDDTEWVNGVQPNDAWMTYVALNVVDAVQQRFRLIDSGDGRAIGGNSEGGYGAMNIALHFPGEFGLVESWSGYAEADSDPRYFGTSAALVAANSPSVEVRRERSVLLHDGMYFWFYCGRNDGDYVDNRQFAAELTSLGLPHHFFAPPGDHNWGVWREFVPAALEAAASHLAAAGS